jgi:sugar phosphate isomerase/epimerase
LTGRAPSPTHVPGIGLQLHTVRNLARQDLPATLAAIAELGYDKVEFAGYFDHPPASIPSLLAEAGLTAPSAHVSPDALLQYPQTTLDGAAAAGHKYVVLAWWEQPLDTPPACRELADLLNRCGQLARERGLSLAYHNHDFEFATSCDWVPYDLLFEESEPGLVSFELDLYWAARAQHDPLALISANPDRFSLLHAKDIDTSGAETDVGSGQIDFARIIAELPDSAVEYIFVERDEPVDPMASAGKGLTSLKQCMKSQG